MQKQQYLRIIKATNPKWSGHVTRKEKESVVKRGRYILDADGTQKKRTTTYYMAARCNRILKQNVAEEVEEEC